jgi:hypothetical protein
MDSPLWTGQTLGGQVFISTRNPRQREFRFTCLRFIAFVNLSQQLLAILRAISLCELIIDIFELSRNYLHRIMSFDALSCQLT